MFDLLYAVLGFPLGWLMWLCYQLITNYLIALILFTLLTKVILFPLQIKQQKSSVRMAYYQPQIQAIQKKYEKNREKQQQAVMEFQQKHKLGLGAGCGPMFLPFIVLFGVIDVVYKPLTHILHLDYFWQADSITDQAVKLMTDGMKAAGQALSAHETGLYSQLSLIHHLQEGTPGIEKAAEFLTKEGVLDEILALGENMNALGLNMGTTPWIGFPSTENFVWQWELLIPVLAGLSAFFTSWLSNKLNPSAQQTANQPGGGCMKVLIYGMPLFSAYIALTVPAGVGIYWVISNIGSLLSTIVLRKMYNPEKYKEQLAKEQAELEAAERKKNTIVVEQEVETDGETKIEQVEVVLSKKEAERRAIAEARRRMAEKYGDALPAEEEAPQQRPKKK